jgi:hypothetical protein
MEKIIGKFKKLKIEHEMPNKNESSYNHGYVKAMNDAINTLKSSGSLHPVISRQTIDAIKEIAKLAKREHYYCVDSWYSCPKAEDGCANDDYDENECSCGADEHNAKIEKLIKTIEKELFG